MHPSALTLDRGLRHAACAAVAAALLAAGCGGGSKFEDSSTRPSITVTPDPVVVSHLASAKVRVDVVGAGGESPTGYAMDLDERLSGIQVSTAACPAGVGTPACREWTITPGASTVAGEYLVRLRSVGLAAVATGSFLIEVPSPMMRGAGATRVVTAPPGGRPSLAVLTASGQLGVLGRGELSAAGHLYRPLLEGGDLAISPAVQPLETHGFIWIPPPEGAWWVDVEMNHSLVMALASDGTVWVWGHLITAAFGHLASNDSPSHLLRPTRVPELQNIRDISIGGPDFAAADGQQLWTSSTYSSLLSTGPGEFEVDPLARGVQAVAGGGATVMFVNGSVRVKDIWRPRKVLSAVAGLPTNIVAIASDPLVYLTNQRPPPEYSGYHIALDSDGGAWRIDSGPTFDRAKRIEGLPPVSKIEVRDEVAYLLADGAIWQLRKEETMPRRIVAPPPGRRFIALAPGAAITDDCSGSASGALWLFDENGLLERVPAIGWDSADCPGAPVEHVMLTVQLEGRGRLMSNPAYVDCSGNCAVAVPKGIRPRLFAVAEPGWRADPITCEAASAGGWMSDASCRVRFRELEPEEFRVSVHVGWGGEVRSEPSGLDCGGRCTHWFNRNPAVAVRLLATPARGYRFEGFAGDADCADGTLTMTGPRVCEARFGAQVPPAPSGLAATATPSSVTLRWAAGGDDALVGYRLDRAAGQGPFALLATLSRAEIDYVDTDVVAGTTYTYRLTPLGPEAAGAAATLAATTGAAPPPPTTGWIPWSTPSNPTIPTGVSVFSPSRPSVAVWAGADVIAYSVQNPATNRVEISVRQWNGGWQPMGQPLVAPLSSFNADPVLVVSATQRLAVVWTASVGEQRQLFAAFYDGLSQWRIGFSGQALNWDALASVRGARATFASDDALAVAWNEGGLPRLARVDALTRMAFGGQASPPGAAATADLVALAVTPEGEALLAWSEDVVGAGAGGTPERTRRLRAAAVPLSGGPWADRGNGLPAPRLGVAARGLALRELPGGAGPVLLWSDVVTDGLGRVSPRYDQTLLQWNGGGAQWQPFGIGQVPWTGFLVDQDLAPRLDGAVEVLTLQTTESANSLARADIYRADGAQASCAAAVPTEPLMAGAAALPRRSEPDEAALRVVFGTRVNGQQWVEVWRCVP